MKNNKWFQCHRNPSDIVRQHDLQTGIQALALSLNNIPNTSLMQLYMTGSRYYVCCENSDKAKDFLTLYKFEPCEIPTEKLELLVNSELITEAVLKAIHL